MREIKFRAWDKFTSRYDNTMLSFADNIVAEWGRLEVEQFTGLRDKNGKEIYEGDILSYKRSSRTLVDKVAFSNGAFWCGYHDGSSTRKAIKLIQGNRVEVIGNIHENPELIDER